ncbi:MAG: class I SAM-dependent methyltransferase [Candidatus Competibacteraceae bacterium]|nr:class I SAM-dependent methyltransferase [Candidatus Competibacteraceae bacterium]
MTPNDCSIAVVATDPHLREQAAILAAQLVLPLTVELADSRFTHLLVLSPEHLALQAQGGTGSVYVDFAAGNASYRRHFGGGRRQLLGRAMGLKSGYRPTVLDATAGLGRDAFVLAGLGCCVQLVERSPIIGALLQDGLERAATVPDLGAWINTRMQLCIADSHSLMATLPDSERPAVVYLDPMYPHRTKTALVKKEMRMLQRIIGADNDSAALLQAALSCARRRVVVKRPCQALPLTGSHPDVQYTGKTTRFDVYLRHGDDTSC